MAYNKQTWTTGEIITAEKLNHIENGIEECCSGGGNIGYECAETRVVLTNESVTTTSYGSEAYGNLSYSQFIDSESIVVTLNDTEYILTKVSSGDTNLYGSIAENSFFISSNAYGNGLCTEVEGIYTVKIEDVTVNATVTPCFKAAVKASQDISKLYTFQITQTGETEWTPSISTVEMSNLMSQGAVLVGEYGNTYTELEKYYIMGRYDAGYGNYGFSYANITVLDSSVKLKIFKFTTIGGSSYEEKTLTVS